MALFLKLLFFISLEIQNEYKFTLCIRLMLFFINHNFEEYQKLTIELYNIT